MNNKQWPLSLLCMGLALFLLIGCGLSPSTSPDKPRSLVSAKEVKCKSPRRQACTREYRPVCATRDSGVRCVKAPCPNTTEKATYANACTACADRKVYTYVAGACQ